MNLDILRKRTIAGLITGAVLAVPIVGIVGGESHPSERIVARIGGASLTYSKIHVPDDGVRRTFEARFGRAPVDAVDMESLTQIRAELETGKMIQYVRMRVRELQIERLNISTSEREIDERIAQMREEADPVDKDRVERDRIKYETFLLAVEAVHLDGDSPDQAYERFQLEGYIPRDLWPSLLASYKSESRRDAARKVIDASPSEAAMRDVARRLVIEEKLNKKIDEDLLKHDTEFAEYKRLAKENPSHEFIREKGPLYIDAKRHEWWQQRYLEAKIEIVDPRFRDVLEAFNE